MPSKYIARASVPEADVERFKSHLGAVYARAALDGIHLATGKGSGSALLRIAVEMGAKYAATGASKAIVALPQTTGTEDAARLIRARGAMTRQECATAAGLKDESSVRNVETRGMPLGCRLRTWVEAQEAGQ